MAPRIPGLEKLGIFDGSEVVPKTKGIVKQNKYKEYSAENEYYFFETDNLGRDMFSRCFMGLGMPVEKCSLGTLLSNGFENALLHPYKLIPAATLMIMLMVGCHLLAEGMKKIDE